MNFEYVVWGVFLLTAATAVRETFRWKSGFSDRKMAIGHWITAGAIAAIGLALAETRWFPGPAMMGNPRGSVRDFLLVLSAPTIPLLGLVELVFLATNISESFFDRGLRRLRQGLCPICAYPQSEELQRCPECGWPSVKPYVPLLWPRSPEPARPWPMRRSQARALYVKWMLLSRQQVGAHDPAMHSPDGGVYRLVANACMKDGRWPNAVFHSDDAWELVAPGSPSSIKGELRLKLGLRLVYADFAKFRSLRFAEVVTTIRRKIGESHAVVQE